MKKSRKKGFTIVELVIVIAIIAILAAVLIPTFSRLIRMANQSADKQEIASINTLIRAENPVGDISIADALTILYENNKNVITRDEDYTYVWNKSEQKFEYLERSKVDTLGDEYENMSFAQSIDDVQQACENGGLVYLDKDLTLNDSAVKTLSVKNDLILVGGKNNLVLSSCTDAMFSMDSDDVSLSVFGMKLSGKGDSDKTGTNAAIRVNCNNAKINICDCDFSSCAYLINVRNYANLSYNAVKTSVPTFTNQRTENSDRTALAEDATCTVTVKNSKLSGKSCINWKYVGGSCLIENCTLYSTSDWTLIAVEGNGVHITVKDSSFINTNPSACTALMQCFAKDNTVELTNCTVSGNGVKSDAEMVSWLMDANEVDDPAEVEDLAKYSGKLGGVYIDLADVGVVKTGTNLLSTAKLSAKTD